MAVARTYDAPFPYACPFCGLEATVYFSGPVPHLIPKTACAHAIAAYRSDDTVVVSFVPDSPAEESR